MSLSFYRKLSYAFGYILLAVLFGLAIFAANIEIKDLDLWLHIKMGKVILENGYVPAVDILSNTVAGKPWINHEWLFQVVVYWVYSHWGADGLITMQAIVVALTLLLLLFIGYNRDRQLGIAFLLLLVMLVYRQRFTIRPDIFSLLFFSCYIYFLAFHIDKKWTPLAIFLVQVLWVNFHGFSFIGPVMVLVGIIAEWIKRHVRLPWKWNEAGRLTDDEFRQLGFIFLISVLASFFNPMTFKGAWYPISVLLQISGKSKVFFHYIVELQPPIRKETLFSVYYYPFFKLLIVFSVISIYLNRKKIDIGDVIIWFLFLFAALVAVRNMVFFAFVAYLICLTNFSALTLTDILPFKITDRKFIYIFNITMSLIMAFWMLDKGIAMAKQGYFDFDKYEMKSEFGGVSQRSFPTKAADFLVANHVKGNFFNDFNSGAYLVGRCYPNIRVFIDGRTEVYGPDFFAYYQKIWTKADTKVLADAIKRYDLTGAFLNSVNKEIPKPVLKYFYDSPEWVLVYLNYDGAIFLKDIPLNADVIQKHRLNLNNWKVKPFDLLRLGTKMVVPYRYVNRAYTLEELDFDDAALGEVQEALDVSPGYAEPYKIMGKIFGKREEDYKAFKYYRIASMIMAQDTEVRGNLGLAYEKLGDYQGAIRQYRIIIRQTPSSAKGYFLMARAYAKEKDYTNVKRYIKEALKRDPNAVKTVIKIGEIAFDNGDPKAAEEIYRLGLDAKKDLWRIHKKIAEALESQGKIENALEELHKALILEPKEDSLLEYQKHLQEKKNKAKTIRKTHNKR